MTAFANGTKGNKKSWLVAVMAVLLFVGVYLPVMVSQRNDLLQSIDAGAKGVSASGGYIIEHDDFYYYANPDDGNCLYRADATLKNPEKLSNHANRSPYIQLSAKGNRVFYLKSVESENNTVLKRLCVYNTETGEETTVFDKNIISYIVLDDWVYCETVSPAQTYRVRLDGGAVEKVGDEYPNAFATRKWALANDALISITHEGIKRYDPVSGQTMGFQGYSADFTVDDTKIYSINYNDRYALEQYNAETMSYTDKKRLFQEM